MNVSLPPVLTRFSLLQDVDFEAGVALLIDKPFGWSSFKVVHRVKRSCAVRKVGHAGTLDPAATGLLIVLTGRATKQQSIFMGQHKEYRATILLGTETDTWDLAGHLIRQQSADSVSRNEIDQLLKSRFFGEFEQRPPAFSALKIGGQPSYHRARRGEAVELQPRKVTVYDMALLDWSPPEFTVQLLCSSGFYVRALAQEIGQILGCGATLKGLVRTAIGSYRLLEAWSLDELIRTLHERKSTV